MSFRETYDQEKGIRTINRVIHAWIQESAYNKSLFFQPKSQIPLNEAEPNLSLTPHDKRKN